MKNMIFLVLLLLGLLLTAGSASAQRAPKWVPVKGYWVVEDNVHEPGRAVVFFYNQQNQLVYQETVARRINLDRTRTLVRLNRTLEEAVSNFERQAPVAVNTGLLARHLWH